VLKHLSRVHPRDERGAMMIVFAVMLPVILLISILSVDVGNWFVHKKRLQTLVDAAAFAGGNEFSGCFQDATVTNTRIADEALKFAGDINRQPLTQNVQEQEAKPAGDVHIVLNSKEFWDGNLNPRAPGANGYGLDNTWVSPYSQSDASKPCSTSALDVKATDEKVPLLFGFIPVAASPHAYARVEIRKVLDITGLLPFAVPEIAPAKVAALVVNEDVAATDSNSIRGAAWLNNNTPPPPPDLSQWEVWHGDLTGVNLNGNENFGVIILTSRDPAASLNGSLSTVCGQNPAQVNCYGKPAGSQSGISFIHAYSVASPGGVNPPAVRQVELFGACGGDLSAPYFNLTADNGGGSCTLSMQAKIDFGVTGDPRGYPTCAVVTAPGGPMSWSAGGLGGTLGTWTGSVTIAADSGRNVVNLGWQTDKGGGDCGGPKNSGTLPRVAVPYAARPLTTPAASGPVEYLWVSNNDPCCPGAANSINGQSNVSLHVTVGFTPQLQDANPLDPPIALRYASVSGSQNQAVDCDKNINFKDEIVNGCQNPYRPNLRNGDCSNYNSGNLPRTPIAPLPGDDCVITETGDKTGPIRQAMDERFGFNGGATCKTLNYWPNPTGQPPNPNNPSGTFPDLNTDKRVVTLFITDENSFGGSGNNIYPIRRFASFYITAADGLGCPGDYPVDPGPKNVWGHWITYVTPDPNATPSDELCDFDEAGTCIAVLVE
jgi:hypothetical protein